MKKEELLEQITPKMLSTAYKIMDWMSAYCVNDEARRMASKWMKTYEKSEGAE